MPDQLPILQPGGVQGEPGPSSLSSPSSGPSEVGNYFISNYPPFSFWQASSLPQARARLQAPRQADVPLGLYLHIPFCRKHCKFCYFRVYTDKNSRDIETYLDSLATEVELYTRLPAMNPQGFQFVYFGGGTPSFLSSRQLGSLVDRLRRHVDWDDAEEVTFECEPGTLTQEKLATLKSIGVTRLSLGIENFKDDILRENGRAHLSPEIFRSYEQARRVGFRQINIDLIAGMLGETWENWRECVRQAIQLDAESVTIYQMELPFNTVYSKQIREDGKSLLLTDWSTKRAWVDFAFSELERAGYGISSAYTLVKDPARTQFVYRDSLWHGADMIGTGVASFSYLDGIHFQNADRFDTYVESLRRGELPLARALVCTPRERLIREMILQLKLGAVDAGRFRRKFGMEMLPDFQPVYEKLSGLGLLAVEGDRIRVTRAGLLRVDEMLPEFFEPAHRGARYT